VWCKDRPLKESFPELFCLARNRDALMADLRVVSNNVVNWDISFIKLVHDWEVDSISSFINALYSARVGWGGDDKLCWTPKKELLRLNIFTKFFPLLTLSFGRAFGGLRHLCGWLFSLGTVSLGKILTLDNLSITS
jgi:hypothetical protein